MKNDNKRIFSSISKKQLRGKYSITFSAQNYKKNYITRFF